MRNLLYILVLCLLLVGCGGNAEIDRQLAKVERLIEVAPDSAMVIINDIDANALSGKKQKAHYALLKSMALDKNYIDTTTFDVLQPAIDYYLNHGTPKEKLRTYYYQGRIFDNKDDRDNAMNSFAKAIEIGKDGCDSLVLARAYVAQACQSYQLFAFDDYVKNNLAAAKILDNLSQMELASDCLLNAFNGALKMKNKSLADSLYNVLTKLDITDSNMMRRRHLSSLDYIWTYGTPSEIDGFIQQYDVLDLGVDGMMSLAMAYSKLDDYSRANKILDDIVAGTENYDEIRLLAIREPVFEGLRNYKDALCTYKTFSAKMDSINYQKFDYMFNSVEARNEIEFQALRDKERNTRIIWGCIGSIVGLALIVIILLLIVRSNKVKKELAVQKG
ncbi:MAG: hypothetical protein NC453_18280 [Muribaculum sp.]|nr:hypothetical protein [Muribaculum sp.]